MVLYSNIWTIGAWRRKRKGWSKASVAVIPQLLNRTMLSIDFFLSLRMLRAFRFVCSILDKRSSVMPKDSAGLCISLQHTAFSETWQEPSTFEMRRRLRGLHFEALQPSCCFRSASHLTGEAARRKHHTASSQGPQKPANKLQVVRNEHLKIEKGWEKFLFNAFLQYHRSSHQWTLNVYLSSLRRKPLVLP